MSIPEFNSALQPEQRNVLCSSSSSMPIHELAVWCMVAKLLMGHPIPGLHVHSSFLTAKIPPAHWLAD